MTFLLYFLKIILLSALFFGYYWSFLRNKRFHRYNRFFLLGSSLLSLLMPLISIPFSLRETTLSDSNSINLLSISPGNWEETVIISRHPSVFTDLFWQDVACAGYWLIISLLLFSLIRSLLYIRRISRSYPFQLVENIKCYATNEPAAPFSFFNLVFWKGLFDLRTDSQNPVFLHEEYHVRQKHSLDLLLMECLGIFFWFNPFFYLVKKELRAVHEFLADEYATKTTDRFTYAELLLLPAAHQKQFPLTNPFFSNHLKRRIDMIIKKNNASRSYVGRVMILPLFLFLIFAFGFKFTHPSTHAFTKKMTVVIDAGHGGIDPGATTESGIREKDINLQLAKKIEALAPEYSVEVIMSRSTDNLPGNTVSIKDGLAYRAELPSKRNADALISIHMNNATPEQKNAGGFLINIPDANSAYLKSSVALGSGLVSAIKDDYKIDAQLQQPSQSIYIFKNATVPSLIIECGYLSNSADLSFIKQEANQEKIARDILRGIVKYYENQIEH